jgi:hypothetical protein
MKEQRVNPNSVTYSKLVPALPNPREALVILEDTEKLNIRLYFNFYYKALMSEITRKGSPNKG